MLGQRIYEMRVASNWSQVILAKRLGVTKQTVSNWENENIQPSVEMLVRLANLFNVTTDYLLGRDNLTKLSVEGLPDNVIAHLSQLISDFKSNFVE